jgi:hypothetical protein
MSSKKRTEETETLNEVEETQQTNDDDEEDDDENSEDDDRIQIDLSQNEFYQGISTLLEDEEGHNILEYISLLHTELIGINKSLENLKLIRKDITRLADCAEIIVKGKKSDSKELSGHTQTREPIHTREKTSSSKKV